MTKVRKLLPKLQAACATLVVLTLCCATFAAQPARGSIWRSATPEDLRSVIPARAPVIAERIETEMRSASGIVDKQGHTIAGVVLITAGYSANGKYSDFFVTQVPIQIGGRVLPSGAYLIGWTRNTDQLLVTISEAATGKPLVEVAALRNESIHRVESFRIWPPSSRPIIQLGRFTIDYSLP